MAQILKLVLVLSFLLILTFATKDDDAAGTVICNTVYAHEKDETCISTAEKFNLSTEDFLNINPNINCDTIFIGQWLCVDGVASS